MDCKILSSSLILYDFSYAVFLCAILPGLPGISTFELIKNNKWDFSDAIIYATISN